MDLLQLVAGIGLGTLGAKLLDILWLQRRMQEDQHLAWLRDKRLEAFSEVAKAMVSFGLHAAGPGNAYEFYATVSKALLLLDDDGLVKRIDQFVVDLDRLNTLTDSKDPRNEPEASQLYLALIDEGRAVTRLLRNLLLHGGRSY